MPTRSIQAGNDGSELSGSLWLRDRIDFIKLDLSIVTDNDRAVLVHWKTRQNGVIPRPSLVRYSTLKVWDAKCIVNGWERLAERLAHSSQDNSQVDDSKHVPRGCRSSKRRCTEDILQPESEQASQNRQKKQERKDNEASSMSTPKTMTDKYEQLTGKSRNEDDLEEGEIRTIQKRIFSESDQTI